MATENGNIYVDTMNRITWKSSPEQIDVAILYPIDSYGIDGIGSVEDVQARGVKKTFLVTWTDNQDISWVKQYDPVHVVFDAEAEEPEYHRRVIEITTPPPLTGL